MVKILTENRPSTLKYEFFIKDKIQSGEIKIDHCRTENIIGDYFIKLKQGKKFKKIL